MQRIEPEPLLVTYTEAKRLLGCGNTKLHQLKRQNRFESVMLGNRPMAVYASLKPSRGANIRGMNANPPGC